jgi:hypothetical protein
MRPDEFRRRWEASGNWMLVVVPAGPARVGREDVRGLDAGAAVEHGGTCDALVREGVRLAGRNDLAAAERALADAAYRCGDAASYRELAGVRALQRRWTEAADLARRAVERDAGDLHAWRILATARYITGDARGALDAWNHAGEPRVDVVSIAGLVRTSHRVVERYLDVQRGEVLSAGDLARAGRRLDELPAAALARVEFVPRGSGLAEVRGHVVERSVVPRGRITWAALGLRAGVQRELLFPVASLGHGGERLDASWRFWPGRPRVGVALHAPWRASIVSLQVAAERQPFGGAEPLPTPAEQLTASGAIGGWATSWLRWEARGGMARWQDEGSFGTAGAAARVAVGPAYVGAAVDAWMGDGSFARGFVDAGWRSSAERRGLVVDLRGGVQAVARRAPLDLWPAGDTGHVRTSLLRAHPALDGARLRLDRLGRVLLHASGEVQQWWRAGAVPIGASVFADVGRTARRVSAASPIADVDAGAGVRVALPAGAGVLRADVAHGLRDGRNAFSIGWAP